MSSLCLQENPKDVLAGLLFFFFSSKRRSAVLKLYKSWYETLLFADRAVIAAVLNYLDILLFQSVMVDTSCMGNYYVLNTYFVLYLTYNTLHTHTGLNKARYSYTQLCSAIQG